MKAFIQDLFEYNRHCNRQIIGVLSGNPAAADEKGLSILSHMLNAHHIWNKRITGDPSAHAVWSVHSINDTDRIDEENHQVTLQLLIAEDLQRIVRYTTSVGTPFANPVLNILFHVINHSTYHRGQLALKFRDWGLDPVPTDYIFYKRNM